MFLLGFWVFFPLFLFCFVGLFVCFLGYSIHFCTGKLLGCALTVRLLFDLRFYCQNRCIYLLLILKGRLGDDLCLSTVTFVVRLISVPLVTSYFAIVSVYVYLLYSIIWLGVFFTSSYYCILILFFECNFHSFRHIFMGQPLSMI